MKRREYIYAGIVTGVVTLGGCMNVSSSEDGPPDGAKRLISVEDIAVPPEEAPFTFTVSVDEQRVTAASTARLSVMIENAGSTSETFRPAYYKGSSGDLGEPGVLLYSLDAPDSPPTDYAPPCFSDAPQQEYVSTYENGEEGVGWTLEYPLGEELAPEESLSDTLLVVDDPTVDGCIPPGRYQFGQRHDYGSDNSFEWTWTLVVEDVSNE